jgi:hypothetical protein
MTSSTTIVMDGACDEWYKSLVAITITAVELKLQCVQARYAKVV